MKKKVTIQLDTIHYDLEGPIDEAIERLQRYKAEYPSRELTISWEQGRYSDSDYLYLNESRDETDEEYAERLANEAETEKNREEYLRQQYEKLKAKFEVQS